MKCPHCGAESSSVVESRPTDTSVRRRRLCGGCSKRFTTYEVVGDQNTTVSIQAEARMRNGKLEVTVRHDGVTPWL